MDNQFQTYIKIFFKKDFFFPEILSKNKKSKRERRDRGIGSDEARFGEFGDKFGHRQRQELSSPPETGLVLQYLVPQSSCESFFFLLTKHRE